MGFHRLSLAKFLELIITFACLGLHYNSMGEKPIHTELLVSGTFVGFSIILIALFAGYMMDTPINKTLDMFFSLIGAAMFIASGALIIEYWNDNFKTETRDLAIAKGSLAIINGILFLLDSLFTFRD